MKIKVYRGTKDGGTCIELTHKKKFEANGFNNGTLREDNKEYPIWADFSVV